MRAVTTRSGLAYKGLLIPTNYPLEKVVKQNTEELTDKEHSNFQGSIVHIQPPVVPISIPEPDVPRNQPKTSIPYRSRLNDQKLREKATNQMEKFFQIFQDLHFDISFADALILMPKFASTIKRMEVCHALSDLGRSFLRIGRALIDVYGEEITLRYNPKSSSPTLVFDPSIPESDSSKEPIVKSSSPTLTPFGERGYSFLKKLLNEYPFQLPSMDLKVAEEFKAKSSIEEPPELELKELPSHLEYAFLEDSNKLPVIIAKNLKDVEREALINVLKSHKRAIAWKISDIKGIDPRFYTHKILIKDD
nr:reverse transcriptase domain-containing protein [Tanacetum cinerariifolium]